MYAIRSYYAPALIIGAFAERMKFSPFAVFSLLWATIVYDPVAHWVWGVGGFMREWGALDFAGGTVVHINAGIDVIWFGIFIVVVVEMAQITPPIGFNLFVLQGMTRHDIGYSYNFV